MKCVNYLLVLIFIFPIISNSQNINYPFFDKMEGKRIVYSDIAITRVAPSSGATYGDTLKIGDTINILMTVPYSENRLNVESPWLKISYKKREFTKVSFISAIDIAINEQLNICDATIIFGIENKIQTDSLINKELVVNSKYQLGLKMIFNKTKIDATNFLLPTNFNVDTCLFELIKLNKNNFTENIMQIKISSNNKLEGSRTFSFTICKNKIISLPTLQNYFSIKNKSWTHSYFNFKSKKIFSVISKNIINNSEIKYKWMNCNFKKL